MFGYYIQLGTLTQGAVHKRYQIFLALFLPTHPPISDYIRFLRTYPKKDIRFRQTYFTFFMIFFFAGSITNIDDDAVKCKDGSSPEIRNKVISGVVGAASSVTSIQVANLLRLFKIPQVNTFKDPLYS